MKKICLVLLPLAAMTLVGCRGGRGGSTDTPTSQTPTSQTPTTVNPTTSSSPASTTSSAPTSSSASSSTTSGAPQPTTPVPGSGAFDFTPGAHSVTIDFATQYADLKEGFPYVGADTHVYDAKLDNLDIKGRGSYVSSYNSSGFLMMKNKDMDGNPAFIANQVSLGSITSISFTTGSSASTNAVYNVYVTNSAQSDSSTAGHEYSGTGSFKCTDGGTGGFFVISSTNIKYNGQLGSLTIEYTIS